MTLFPAQTVNEWLRGGRRREGVDDSPDQTRPDEGPFNLSRKEVGLSEIGSPTLQQRDSGSEGS